MEFLDFNARLQAGDRYSAMLIDPSGAIIAMKEATATSYSTFDICDGTCYTAHSGDREATTNSHVSIILIR